MKKIAFVFLTIGLLASNNLMAETVLYCQSELATGAIKRNGSWETSDFKQKRYTVKFNKDYSKLDGLADRSFNCVKAYASISDTLVCSDSWNSGDTFIFNKKTKRFIFSWPAAAFGYEADNTDTPVMYLGTCKKF